MNQFFTQLLWWPYDQSGNVFVDINRSFIKKTIWVTIKSREYSHQMRQTQNECKTFDFSLLKATAKRNCENIETYSEDNDSNFNFFYKYLTFHDRYFFIESALHQQLLLQAVSKNFF